MRKNLGAKTLIYPMPVLMIGSYDKNGNADIMNAAWGGIYDTNKISISLADEHKTTMNIKETGAFTVSFATESTVIPCDYVGIVSAKNEPNKVEIAGFNPQKSEFVNAPLFKELPLALECEVIKFNEDGILIGKIVNVSADERILNDKTQVDIVKLAPICFDGSLHTYNKIGEVVGNAFSDGKKIK